MGTHPNEERPREDPRTLDEERHHASPDAARGESPETPTPADGGMVRSEPAASRQGEGLPRRQQPQEQAHPVARQGDDRAPVHPHEGPGNGNGQRLMRPEESDDLRRRWESIQASFIDAPRESVEEADRLVGELTDRIAERFRSERSGLETQWERGDEVSTEDLRLTLQRYRGFFDRLLHL